MARWLAKLNLVVTEAEVVSTPAGPGRNIKQQLEFTCGAEEPGDSPAAALNEAMDRLHNWIDMLTMDKRQKEN